MEEESTEATTTQPADSMADGRADGGWDYIWAAYILTWGFLLGYAIYVNVRREMMRRRAQDVPPG